METTDTPLAYFITFTCYGTWLHGDDRGSVDRDNNVPGTPFLLPDSDRQSKEATNVAPYSLDDPHRQIALKAIVEIASKKAWTLWAAHVRSNHIHVVVTAASPVERVMNDIKAAVSRRLNKAHPFERDCVRWTRHGSTRYLWRDEQLEAAVQYVVDDQGEKMAVFDSRLIPSRARSAAE